jgi:hypothetical protein
MGDKDRAEKRDPNPLFPLPPGLLATQAGAGEAEETVGTGTAAAAPAEPTHRNGRPFLWEVVRKSIAMANPPSTDPRTSRFSESPFIRNPRSDSP